MLGRPGGSDAGALEDVLGPVGVVEVAEAGVKELDQFRRPPGDERVGERVEDGQIRWLEGAGLAENAGERDLARFARPRAENSVEPQSAVRKCRSTN